jgi:hypothetical protein
VHISRFLHKVTHFERPKDTGSIFWPLGASSVRLTHLRHPTSGTLLNAMSGFGRSDKLKSTVDERPGRPYPWPQ